MNWRKHQPISPHDCPGWISWYLLLVTGIKLAFWHKHFLIFLQNCVFHCDWGNSELRNFHLSLIDVSSINFTKTCLHLYLFRCIDFSVLGWKRNRKDTCYCQYEIETIDIGWFLFFFTMQHSNWTHWSDAIFTGTSFDHLNNPNTTRWVNFS